MLLRGPGRTTRSKRTLLGAFGFAPVELRLNAMRCASTRCVEAYDEAMQEKIQGFARGDRATRSNLRS